MTAQYGSPNATEPPNGAQATINDPSQLFCILERFAGLESHPLPNERLLQIQVVRSIINTAQDRTFVNEWARLFGSIKSQTSQLLASLQNQQNSFSLAGNTGENNDLSRITGWGFGSCVVGGQIRTSKARGN